MKKKNSGFTILEVVIATAIAAMIYLSIAMTISRTSLTHVQMENASNAIDMSNVIINAITGEFALARDIEFQEDKISYTYDGYQKYLPMVVNGTEGSGTIYKTTIQGDGGDWFVIAGKPYVYGAVFDANQYKDMDILIAIQEVDKTEKNLLIVNIFFFKEEYYNEITTDTDYLKYVVNNYIQRKASVSNGGVKPTKGTQNRIYYDKADKTFIYISKKPVNLYNAIQ